MVYGQSRVVCVEWQPIYIIYTPNLGWGITVPGREGEQGSFRGSTEGARWRSEGAPREQGGAEREHGGALGEQRGSTREQRGSTRQYRGAAGGSLK